MPLDFHKHPTLEIFLNPFPTIFDQGYVTICSTIILTLQMFTSTRRVEGRHKVVQIKF